MSKEKKPYTVGYGKTPKHTRFKPGQSGNRKGRPKKKVEAVETPDLCGSIVSELQTKIVVTENGKRVELTKQEAITKRLVNKALEGDSKAIALLMHPDMRAAVAQHIDAMNLQAALEEEADLSTLTAEELTARYRRAIGQ